MALVPPQYLDAVVAIGVPNTDDKPSWIASGFLYGHTTGETMKNKKGVDTTAYDLYLVTNRHVLEDKDEIILRFNHYEGQKAKEIQHPTKFPDGKPVWQAHENKDIDIAVAKLNGPKLQNAGLVATFFRSDIECANVAKLKEVEVAEGDYVYVLGFPLGLVGNDYNYTVVRKGIIARIKDTLDHKSNSFLLDAFIFPGNSGGPVILKPDAISITGTKKQNNAYLIGIINSYIPYLDVAISPQTKRARISFEENSGLAKAFPLDYVEDIIKNYTVKNQSDISKTTDEKGQQ